MKIFVREKKYAANDGLVKRNSEEVGGILVHEAVVIFGRKQTGQYMKIILIKRTVTMAVMQIGVRAVNGVVTAEHDLFNSCGLNEQQGALHRDSAVWRPVQ